MGAGGDLGKVARARTPPERAGGSPEAVSSPRVSGVPNPATPTGATAKGAGGDAFSDEKLEALFRSMEAKFKAEMGLVDAEGEGEAAEGGY